LRHQISVLQRSFKRPKLTAADRFFWVRLASVWNGWEFRVSIFNAAPVIRLAAEGLCLYWNGQIRRWKPCRPAVPKEVRDLIRMLSRESPLLGTPHARAVRMSANMNAHNPTANRAGIEDFKWLKRSSDDLLDDMPLNVR
jgi:hypothetical protein